MHRYQVQRDQSDFDLSLCVTTGQVFRWNRFRGTTRIGVDGRNWYLVDEIGGGYDVRSSVGKEEFFQLFQLEQDLFALAQEIEAKVPELAGHANTLQGLRLMKPSSPPEAFFSFLCTPNNNLKRITPMVEKLASYGLTMETPDGTVPSFPSIETIAAIPEQDLRDMGFGYRAATITRSAKEILQRGGEDWLGQLRQASFTEARSELLSLYGVGPKLADCIALYALHHTEAVPVDTHVWQSATRTIFPDWAGTSLTLAKYEAIGNYLRSRLGPLAAYAQQFMFVDNLLRKTLSSPRSGSS